MICLVTYTLNPNRETPSLIEELKKSDGWAHHLDYTWFIATKESLDELYERLAIRFRDTDHFIIIRINPSSIYKGWLPKPAWDWLAENWNY